MEKKILATITVNKDKNNNGLLEIDDIDNKLISEIDSGYTPIHRLSKYDSDKQIILYNEMNKHIDIVKEGEFLKMDLDFSKGTKYFLDAKIIKSKIRNENVFTVPMERRIPLKIYLHGRELKNYIHEGDTITVNGLTRNLLDDFSEIVVYCYMSDRFTDSGFFEIEYYQYESVWDFDRFMEETYFENGDIPNMNIKNFESISVSQEVQKTTTRKSFQFNESSIINSVSNTVEFDVFGSKEQIDLVHYVGRDEFRIVAINPSYGRVVIVNNCSIVDGVSLVYDKSKNSKKFNTICGNYIDVEETDSSVYSLGKYGKGNYSASMYIYNSHRQGR